MNEITIGDKVYISAKRAAEITGYARDYVGQLCREGHIEAKMVGRSWYVFEPSIRAHRFGEEVVVAQVDSEVVEEAENTAVEMPEEPALETTATASEWQRPTYTSETQEMIPELTPADIEELLPPAEETLTDMQAAWREWFDQKKKVLDVPEIESPEVIDARNDAYEAENEAVEAPEVAIPVVDEDTYNVPLQRIHEEPEVVEEVEEEAEEEVIVPIHHIEPVEESVYVSTPAARMDIGHGVPVMQDTESDGRVISERIIQKGSRRLAASRVRHTNAPVIAVLIGVSFISITIAVIGTGYAGKYLRTLPAANNPVINFLVGTQKISK